MMGIVDQRRCETSPPLMLSYGELLRYISTEILSCKWITCGAVLYAVAFHHDNDPSKLTPNGRKTSADP